ncbi:hypothetical protein Tco_0606697 [Tanacetum coccineum]
MPESSQQHIKIERICFDCGDLLHGLNCLECDLTRKILEKAFQKFQNTSKSSNDNSNVVNAPREPFVVKQDPSWLNLVPIPSESKGVPKVCDVPFHDNSPPLDISKDQSEDFSDSNVDSTSTDEDSFSSNDIEYVEASPPNSEPVSSKDEPELGNFTMDVVGNIFQKREPRVHVRNVLPTLELAFIPSSESIFAICMDPFSHSFHSRYSLLIFSLWDEDTIFIPAFQKVSSSGGCDPSEWNLSMKFQYLSFSPLNESPDR